MSDLNWQLRRYLHELRDDGRLFVLLSIYLHRNIRNRSWPSYDTIMEETGYERAPVSRAIKWLQEQRAFVLVPYGKRIGEEKNLPKRKNIYQLTGIIRLGGQFRRYMYLTPEGWQGIAHELNELGESSLSELLYAGESSFSESSLSEPKVVTSLKDDKEESAPNGAHTPSSKKKIESKKREPNPLFDAVALHIFGIDPAEVNGNGGRIGRISSWLEGKSDGIKHGNRKETVGFISAPAEPAHVEKFAAAWKATHPNTDIPLDFIKFVEAWRKWASSRKANAAKRQPTQTPATPPPTEEEKRAFAEARRNIRPAWEKEGK